MSLYVRDLAERVAATFLQGFAGAVVITELNDLEMYKAAAAAGLAAVVSLAKGLLAKKVGNNDSASLDGGV
ncbi:holin [Streptomyces cellulosae]